MIDSHGNTIDLEAEFYCQNCQAMRDVRVSDPDILCDLCAFVIATFSTREVIVRVASPCPAPEPAVWACSCCGYHNTGPVCTHCALTASPEVKP